MLNALILGGVSSADYGIILTAPPPRIVPARDVDTHSIPGRSGDLTVDKGRYRNVTLPCRCAILPKSGKTLRQAVTAALPFLTPTAGYRRFETTYDSSYYMEARISGDINVDSIVEQGGTFQLKLDCKPQRYLKSGETALNITGSGLLNNPTPFASVPFIEIDTNGNLGGVVRIGDYSVNLLFSGIPATTIYLDCDILEAWYLVDGAEVSCNQIVSSPNWPKIEPGTNSVDISGIGIDAARVYPRWWKI